MCVRVHVHACVCMRYAPKLTRYHMKIVLKAFSLEQEPQAMVISWDIPLGATCREGNSGGLSPVLNPYVLIPIWGRASVETTRWAVEAAGCRGMLEGSKRCPASSWRESGLRLFRGGGEAQEGPKAGEQRGREGAGKPRLSLLTQPPLPRRLHFIGGMLRFRMTLVLTTETEPSGRLSKCKAPIMGQTLFLLSSLLPAHKEPLLQKEIKIL